MFDYFDTFDRQERAEVADELRAMYNAILAEENEAWTSMIQRRSAESRQAYAEANGKLGAVQGIFEILHIPFEFGKKMQ